MSWAVIVNNVAALEILVGCGYVRAGMLVGVGALVRGVVQSAMLGSVGLGTEWDGGLEVLGQVKGLLGW